METLPGEEGVPRPSWASSLRFDPSGPFRVSWHNQTETAYRTYGHLINTYNEDRPVYIGRDGQEIEPECGRKLCELMDRQRDAY